MKRHHSVSRSIRSKCLWRPVESPHCPFSYCQRGVSLFLQAMSTWIGIPKKTWSSPYRRQGNNVWVVGGQEAKMKAFCNGMQLWEPNHSRSHTPADSAIAFIDQPEREEAMGCSRFVCLLLFYILATFKVVFMMGTDLWQCTLMATGR